MWICHMFSPQMEYAICFLHKWNNMVVYFFFFRFIPHDRLRVHVFLCCLWMNSHWMFWWLSIIYSICCLIFFLYFPKWSDISLLKCHLYALVSWLHGLVGLVSCCRSSVIRVQFGIVIHDFGIAWLVVEGFMRNERHNVPRLVLRWQLQQPWNLAHVQWLSFDLDKSSQVVFDWLIVSLNKAKEVSRYLPLMLEALKCG